MNNGFSYKWCSKVADIVSLLYIVVWFSLLVESWVWLPLRGFSFVARVFLFVNKNIVLWFVEECFLYCWHDKVSLQVFYTYVTNCYGCC